MSSYIINEWLNETVEVPEGHEVCPRCHGYGYRDEYDTVENPTNCPQTFKCWLCKGQGYVDWITFIKNNDWIEKFSEDELVDACNDFDYGIREMRYETKT